MKRLSLLLGDSLEQKEIVRAAEAWQALNRWPEIVGEGLSLRSWPDRFEHGTVYVAVLGSAWAQELRMIKPLILSRLAGLLRNGSLVQDVRFGVRPLPGRANAPTSPAKEDRKASDETLSEIAERILNRVKDEE